MLSRIAAFLFVSLIFILAFDKCESTHAADGRRTL